MSKDVTVEMRVSVTLEIPDHLAAKVTKDDMAEMAGAAIQQRMETSGVVDGVGLVDEKNASTSNDWVTLYSEVLDMEVSDIAADEFPTAKVEAGDELWK